MAGKAKMPTFSLCASPWCFQRLALYDLALCICPDAYPLLGAGTLNSAAQPCEPVTMTPAERCFQKISDPIGSRSFRQT